MIQPKVSVIVPVYNVEPYIEHCLETLVNQTLTEIEIIVVNDGSTDNSQVSVDRYAKKYPDRVFPYHKENGGLSDARNFGMQRARGDYIGFVDSDDYVEETMFEKLYEKAAQEDADIVVCGYYAIDEAAGKTKTLQTGNLSYFNKSLFDNPKLLYVNAPYAWNKLFRRSMLEENALQFPKGLIFEDIATSYPAFLCAAKISKVDEPLYHYYLRRKGSITATYSNKFMQLLDSLSIMNDFYKKRKHFLTFANVLLFINLKHIFIRFFEFPMHNARDFQLQFLKKSFAHLNQYFPRWKHYDFFFNFHYNGQSRRLLTNFYYWYLIILCPNKLLLFFYRLFQVWPQQIIKQRKRFRQNFKLALQFKSHLRSIYVHYYKHRRVKPNTVLFESFHGRNISDSPFYLMRELAKYKQFDIYFTTGSREAHAKFLRDNGFKIKLVELNSLKYQKLLASAKYLINNVSFPTYFIKKPDQIYVNTWHGTPLKTLGKNMIKGISDMHNIQHNFLQSDYLLFPNLFTMEQMMRDYSLEDLYTGKAVISGYPRNSVFLESDGAVLRKQLRLQKKTVFAYMPTWRGEKSSKLGIGAYKTMLMQQLTTIDRYLKDNQRLYVNLHPLLQRSVSLKSFHHIFPFPKHVDNYAFLNCCDALITDYSSVFFDYALTKKPIALFMYDYDSYMNNRGVYFDICALPFTKIYDVAGMCDYLKRFPESVESYAGDTMFFSQFLRYDSQDCAKKLVDSIFFGKESEFLTFDYAKNRENAFRLFLPCAHPTHEQLLRGIKPNTVSVFQLQDFDDALNTAIYNDFRENLPFVIVSGTEPVTHLELLRFNRKIFRSPKTRGRIYRRELQRILPNLSFVSIHNDNPKSKRLVGIALAAKQTGENP